MILEQAIEEVVGVTMEDMRGAERTHDRLFGRVLYSKLSGLPRAEVARRLGKAFTSITYYLDSYDWLMATSAEFRSVARQVEQLI